MSSPASSSSSDDDDITEMDILALVKGDTPTRPKRAKIESSTDTLDLNRSSRNSPSPTSKSKSGTPHSSNEPATSSGSRSQSLLEEDSAFDFHIPSIFRFDAVRNEKLHKFDLDLKKDFLQEEQRLQNEYEEVIKKKRQIMVELNDNGSLNTKVYTLENDSDTIERLLKQSLNKTSGHGIHRHFYFFRSVFEIKLPWKLPFPVNDYLFYELATQQKRERLRKRLEPVLPDFINYLLENNTNLAQLRQFNHFLEEWVRVRPDGLPPARESFSYHLEAIGGNTDFISPRKSSHIPVKIGQFNNNIALSLARASIIFNFHLCYNSGSPNSMLETFILILCDFNVNEYEFGHLAEFVRSVFPSLAEACSPGIFSKSYARQDFYYLFYSTLGYCIKPCIYGQDRGSDSSKTELELCYNVLRLLNVCFASSQNEELQLIISDLSTVFLLDNDGDEKEPSRDITPSAATLKGLFRSLKSSSDLTGFEDDDTDSLTIFYKNYYRIELLKYVLLKSFKNNQLDDQDVLDKDKYEQIRQSNVKRLTGLITQLNDLRTSYQETMKSITFMDSKDAFQREERVKCISNIYYTLSYLANKFEKDLSLIKSDIFYT